MKSFNVNAITTAVLAALAAGDTFEEQLTTLQKLLKGADRDTIKGIVAPIVATKYGETFSDGQWADSKCAAKRKANRIIGAIAGTAPAQSSSKVAVDKKLVASLRDTIVGAGLTKKQFDAVLSALRASVSFK
jgi:hypothetical protein